MPINAYTGLMRSGKSYEVVSQVIVEAIAQGRRVVTNVDGISNDLIRAFVAEKRQLPIDKLGQVVHCSNEQVFKPDFLPYFDEHKMPVTDTFCQPGDLVCIDEAWRFWGTDCKLHKNHKSFFLEHGHFVHPETKVASDLVLMIQDMGTLHRYVKNVVAFTFRTHKKVSLGLGNTYSLNMWEGPKMTRQTLIGTWVRRYDKEVFPLYSSFKGGEQGKTVNVDKRQNVFTHPQLWALIVLLVVAGVWSARTVWKFFHPEMPTAAKDKDDAKAAPGAKAPPPPGAMATVKAAGLSEEWRFVGEFRRGAEVWFLVVGDSGRLRLESPSIFMGRGALAVGEIDGRRVTPYSGRGVGLLPQNGNQAK